MGWAGIKNGALLRLANGQFDALLTVDQGIGYQQNLSGLTIGIVVMVATSNDVDDLRPLLSGVAEVLVALQPGEIVRVGGQHANGGVSVQRANYEIIGDGRGVHWPDVDEDISAEGGMLTGAPARPPKTRA